jgi:hypothetical protein
MRKLPNYFGNAGYSAHRERRTVGENPSKRPKARFYYYAANHLCDATKSRKFESN